MYLSIYNHGGFVNGYLSLPKAYRTAGVREYWIVDPDKEWVMVYSFFNDDMNTYSFTDDIPAGIHPGFSINLSKLNI